MNILEKEIEDIVFALCQNQQAGRKRGLFLPLANYYRQFNITHYGIADIVGFHFDSDEFCLYITVIEIKKESVNAQTLDQAIRYCKGLKEVFGEKEYGIAFNIVLIGKTLEIDSSFCFYPDILNNVQIYTFGISLENGVDFKYQHGYCLAQNLPANFLKGFVKEIETDLIYIGRHAKDKDNKAEILG